MRTSRKKGFIKVKMSIKGKNQCKLVGKMFCHCCELTTQNIKNIKNFRSQLSKAVLQRKTLRKNIAWLLLSIKSQNVLIK